MIQLDSRPTRTDLTDRECAKLIGGILTALVQMADVETIRRATRFLVEQEGLWQMFAELKAAMDHCPADPEGNVQ